jgi:hypothetical protein
MAKNQAMLRFLDAEKIMAAMLELEGAEATKETFHRAEILTKRAMRGKVLGESENVTLLCRAINYAAKWEEDAEWDDFGLLVDIACEAFRVERHLVLGKCKTHDACAVRNVIGAIWAETHTMADTRKRLNWSSPSQAYHARLRCEKYFAHPVKSIFLKNTLEAVKEKCPHLITHSALSAESPTLDENGKQN